MRDLLTAAARTMRDAADIIERNAEAPRSCHTVAGEWPESEADAREQYCEEIAAVAELRIRARQVEASNTMDTEHQETRDDDTENNQRP